MTARDALDMGEEAAGVFPFRLFFAGMKRAMNKLAEGFGAFEN